MIIFSGKVADPHHLELAGQSNYILRVKTGLVKMFFLLCRHYHDIVPADGPDAGLCVGLRLHSPHYPQKLCQVLQ